MRLATIALANEVTGRDCHRLHIDRGLRLSFQQVYALLFLMINLRLHSFWYRLHFDDTKANSLGAYQVDQRFVDPLRIGFEEMSLRQA